MTDRPLISVIIPTYNRGALVLRAIESVRKQTYKNTEILVVDDCSPDDTESIVRSISDNRIRYIRCEKNKGVSASRNRGIREARGKYIALLDDDDQWREDKLDKQLQVIRDYDAVLCTAVVNGAPLRVHRGSEVSLDDLRQGSFFPSGLLAKTSVLQNVFFDENLRVGEDWDVFIRIAQKYSIGWVEEPLLLYDDGGHSRTTNEGKYLTGHELDQRIPYLYKHRAFFGEKWFKYHMADDLLPYLASRPDKLRCIAYAVKRCGLLAVLVVIARKFRWRVRKRIAYMRRPTA